ncbi:hypothetical protein JTE90_001740 [Oedothorax gibbosus]|uniref:Uncharacterized protein n=1 Tax=Oedothorax gibbosus TaxID=931172 RepID=A0AAV6V705_9ARAC|nr:hypothetical protein JTE90_001740 [Oedothorax gibbosus]
MPLTAAEKQKRYRERLKEKGEYERYKEKNKKLKEKVRNTLCKSAKSKLKEKNKIYKRNERKRKSCNINATMQSPENPDTSNASIVESAGPSTDVDITSPYKVFPTRQSLGKAKKRVISVLPKSPNKRKALVCQIAKDEGLLGKNSKTSSTFQTTTNENSKQVIDFFNDDRVSSQAPGMKDFVICRENGNKIKMQKRYLYLTLKETYALFCEENSDIKIGLSNFCIQRPINVLLGKNIPHNVCLCQKHENIRLLLKVLHNKCINVAPEFKEFIKSVVCNDNNELCMTGGCNSCPMLNGISEDGDKHAEMCNWKEWAVWDYIFFWVRVPDSTSLVQRENVEGIDPVEAAAERTLGGAFAGFKLPDRGGRERGVVKFSDGRKGRAHGLS